VTRVGNHNWVMAYVHVAHDCQVGHHTVLANCTSLPAIVRVDDHAILGGFTGVHQFCRVGAHSITGVGNRSVLQDVPPFVMASDDSARPYGINARG
jgi:UDP-N-acetylglucosamine acyltransferase